MTKVVVNSALSASLDHLSAASELCDESGRLLGYFVPVTPELPALYAWARTAVTDEELERARRQEGGQSLPEFLRSLDQG